VTTFKYTDEEKRNPLGNNSLSARAKFFQRSLYKEVVYPEDTVQPLDSWYDKNLYGRFDQKQNVVLPYKTNLTQLQYGVQPNMLCLNFVNLAFTDFVEHMKTAYLTNCVDRRGNSALFDMRAIISYFDWNSSWLNHRNNIIDAFINNYNPKFASPIKNFNDFKNIFTIYLNNMSQKMPITRTSYILSPFASSFGSGLKIAIAQQDAGDDSIKYQQFISDPNFKFFTRAAKKYGFLVDKYTPWVLTYDLFTNASLNYINYNLTAEGDSITEQNFFNTYYYQSYESDLDILQNFFKVAYSKFVTKKPIYEEEKSYYRKQCNDFSTLQTKYRDLPGNDLLTVQELIDLYITLRYNEIDRSGPSPLKTKKRSYEIYRTTEDTEIAKLNVAKFIDETYKNFIYPVNYGQLNSTLDFTRLTDIVDTVAETAVLVQSNY